VFYHEASDGKYVPRAVPLDLEPGVIGAARASPLELELELMQTHMAKKPMLRVEVCARCVLRASQHAKDGRGQQLG
jgi:hypothetical protein